MKAIIYYVVAGIISVHGLIHLMGFVAYWPLAVIRELPYKTVLAGGTWNVGAIGMKVFGLLWLIAAVGFLAAVGGYFFDQAWWRPVMIGATLLSTAVILLDWTPAFRGAVVNAAILLLMLGFAIDPYGM